MESTDPIQTAGPLPNFGDHIVFVDESGDHNLVAPDP